MDSDMDVIALFESKVSSYIGRKYGASVSSNTNGIFLSFKYLIHKGILKEGDTIEVPKRTYMSVPMSIKNANLNVKFKDIKWINKYKLKPSCIWDAATEFRPSMCDNYPDNDIFVLSFQYQKSLPIGRGGMVITNDKECYDYIVQARFNGRHPGKSQWEDEPDFLGWNMYMTPEQAARGLTLLNSINLPNSKISDTFDRIGYKTYPDISKWKIWK